MDNSFLEQPTKSFDSFDSETELDKLKRKTDCFEKLYYDFLHKYNELRSALKIPYDYTYKETLEYCKNNARKDFNR